MPARRIKVVIVQRLVASYRVRFFQLLHRRLEERGIDLHVAAGQPWADEAFIDSRSSVPNMHVCTNKRLFGKAYWQSGALRLTSDADLVVFEQANAAIINYLFILRRIFFKRTPFTAFWGHGGHLNKAAKNGIFDNWKKLWINKVDHWFAYTSVSKALVEASNFPAAQITNVENAIDTGELRRIRRQLSEQETIDRFIDSFGYAREDCHKVAVYCARLTPLKMIPLLLECSIKLHRRIPGFHLIIIGDGSERDRVARFAKDHNWCVWVGAMHGSERVKYLALGDIWLNPGMTGLSILDAFALGIPFATTDCGIHSPEIAYLQPGENGLLTGFSVEDFVEGVASLLLSPRLGALSRAAYRDSEKYTIENMVKNFASGIFAVTGK